MGFGLNEGACVGCTIGWWVGRWLESTDGMSETDGAGDGRGVVAADRGVNAKMNRVVTPSCRIGSTVLRLLVVDLSSKHAEGPSVVAIS